MKKMTLTVALCCLALISNAQNQNANESKVTGIQTTDVPSSDFVSESQGIDVSYSISNIGGNKIANILFTNTTDKPVTFSWKVSAKNGMSYNSSKLISLKAGQSFTQEGAFEMKGSTVQKDYPITLYFN